jgi:hypothetical protein
MKKAYVLIQDFNAPYVVATGMAHKPSKIMIKKYKKGEIIYGEMKTTNGKPSIVLVKGVIPIPATMLNEVITKTISGVSGEKSTETKQTQNNKVVTIKKTNTRYMDAGIFGAVIGAVAVYLFEKQGWLQPNPKNKLYGALGGAVLGMYMVYRKK